MINIKNIWALAIFCYCLGAIAQTNTYQVSFNNAVHHEGQFSMHFPNINQDTLSLRMANSSPGRYAFHSFAKNVYGFKVTDAQGKPLPYHRPNPYQWDVYGHKGTVHITYTLFANRGDGTFSQIDETHAHLNIPSSFMYAPSLSERPIRVSFDLPEGKNWKIASQLKSEGQHQVWAPNLYYFMDSPLEISNFSMRSFKVGQGNNQQTINFALLHQGTEAELDQYFESVKAIVLEQEKIFGELPKFDFGNYTFLACYMPNVTGDGMEHRNSTILTSTRSLADGGMQRNLGTVSHEFFHAWNVERIRPKSLEPFDFDQADMSGALWFAEGFTSYYTNLVLCRAGLMTPKAYIESLNGSFNYVWNSNGRQFFNPIEMSYQAPFVDAAASLEPQNRNNTFISYYSYGSVLGLALDLSLREKGLNLDDYFKKIWREFGKVEKPYTIADLQQALIEYAGKTFADQFFERYIYDSQMPDYASLFPAFGVKMEQKSTQGFFGGNTRGNTIIQNTLIGSPAYNAGLEKGDQIVSVNGMTLDQEHTLNKYLKDKKAGDQLQIVYSRFGEERQTKLTLAKDPKYTIAIMETTAGAVREKQRDWLKQ